MVRVMLPQSLVSLFPGAPRQAEVDARTVGELIERLNDGWPGMRSRLLDGPRLREHLLVAVDEEVADLSTPLRPGCVVRIIASITGG